jgi:hypothetical protein
VPSSISWLWYVASFLQKTFVTFTPKLWILNLWGFRSRPWIPYLFDRGTYLIHPVKTEQVWNWTWTHQYKIQIHSSNNKVTILRSAHLEIEPEPTKIKYELTDQTWTNRIDQQLHESIKWAHQYIPGRSYHPPTVHVSQDQYILNTCRHNRTGMKWGLNPGKQNTNS